MDLVAADVRRLTLFPLKKGRASLRRLLRGFTPSLHGRSIALRADEPASVRERLGLRRRSLRSRRFGSSAGEVSNLRQSRRLERVSGSKPRLPSCLAPAKPAHPNPIPPFPLTPALSRRERENVCRRRRTTEAFRSVEACLPRLPLPAGEGRGEGEGTVGKRRLRGGFWNRRTLRVLRQSRRLAC